MTKKDLIKALEPYPDNMDVFLAERSSDFAFGLLNSVGATKIAFMEEPGGPVLSRDTVIILDEQ